MKDHIVLLLKDILAGMGISDVIPDVEISDVSAHGEYTTNLAFRLASNAKFKIQNSKLKSPMQIALQVAEEFKVLSLKFKVNSHDQDIHQEDQTETAKIAGNTILQAIDRVEVAPPGFINIFLTEASLSSQLNRVLEEKKSYGSASLLVIASEAKQSQSNQSAMQGLPRPSQDSGLAMTKKKVMVEFTDPNPFKEFHIGHLYSNAVGESLCRLLEASGCEVKRADYFGEVGMHVAKAVWGMLRKFKVQSSKFKVEDELHILEKLSLPERVKWMGQSYAMGAKAFEEDPVAAEEMKRLNKLIFIAAQELLEEKTGKKPMVDYHKGETIDAAELLDIKVLFGTGRQWSLEYFETIYTRLGTKFDLYYPESEVAEYGAKLVMDHIGTVFEKSDGAIVYHGESEGLHTRVFINKLGLPTYEAKELGLNDKKYKDWPFDASIIVTGKEITEYFHVLLSAMGKVIPDVAAKTRHIGHGMVRLPAGKMTSRSGNVITGESLLDSVKQKIYNILDQSESKKSIENTTTPGVKEVRTPGVSEIYTEVEPTFAKRYGEAEKDAIAEAAAVSAVKYSLLKVALPSDITFDLDKSVSFEGDSGPYLLYTYARCKSVLRKADQLVIAIPSLSEGEAISDTKGIAASSRSDRDFLAMTMNPEEHALARLISQFPDVVAGAAATLSPSDICTYLNRLASAFNLFYAKHSILGTQDVGLKTQDVGIGTRSSPMSYILRPTSAPFRLSLTSATAQVLANGLSILGIKTVERM